MNKEQFLEQDTGTCEMRMSIVESIIFLEFKNPVSWVGLDANSAMRLAQALIKNARKINKKEVLTLEV